MTRDTKPPKGKPAEEASVQSAGANVDGARAVDVDAALVRRAQHELPYRTAAYEALMRKYDGLLFSVCLRMLNNRADAEDACQDVMFKVFGTLPKFEGRSSFKTWMMRVATNTCLTAIDKNKRRREGRNRWTEETTDDHVTHMSTAKYDVTTLLDSVKAEYREVLTLRFVADLSLQEIADTCEISLSAAKMRLYRATEFMQSMVSKSEQKPEKNQQKTPDNQ